MTKRSEPSGSATVQEPNSDQIIARIHGLIGDESARKFAQRAGIGQSTLQAVLNGKTLPGLATLMAIARAGGVTIDWLATGEGPRSLAELHARHALLEGAPAGVDVALLRDAVAAVEGVLQELDRTLDPEKKADLIARVYQLEVDAIPTGTRVSAAKIIQLVRAA